MDEEKTKVSHMKPDKTLYKGSAQWVDAVNTYHPPNEDHKLAYTTIRDAAVDFMDGIFHHLPDCQDRDRAITAVREARMWANAAIALNGLV